MLECSPSGWETSKAGQFGVLDLDSVSFQCWGRLIQEVMALEVGTDGTCNTTRRGMAGPEAKWAGFPGIMENGVYRR